MKRFLISFLLLMNLGICYAGHITSTGRNSSSNGGIDGTADVSNGSYRITGGSITATSFNSGGGVANFGGALVTTGKLQANSLTPGAGVDLQTRGDIVMGLNAGDTSAIWWGLNYNFTAGNYIRHNGSNILDLHCGGKKIQTWQALDNVVIQTSMTVYGSANINGAICTWVQNQSGHTLAEGEVLYTSPDYDFAVTTAPVDGTMPVGVAVSSNVAVGSYFWMAISGKTKVMLDNGEASTRGYWVRTSDSELGRAECVSGEPPQTSVHDQEIGHSLETVSAGAGKTFMAIIHFR